MHSDQKSLLIRIGLGAGVFLALLILTFLVNADASRRAEAVQELRQEIASRSSAIERLVRLRSDADASVPYANDLKELLPEPEELLSFPREVRTLAESRDATAQNVSLGTETASTESEPGSIDAQFTAAGTFASFIAFLKSLEERAGFISFLSVDAAVSNRVNASVRTKVFTR